MGLDRRALRNLLLDCRSALRRADARFMESPLREQLDDAIARLDRGLRDEAPTVAATPSPPATPAAGIDPPAADDAAQPPVPDAQARPHARGDVPDAARLRAVLAGERALEAAEREACIGEALVRSGFSANAGSLAALDDAALARLLLEEMPAPEWPVNTTWTRRPTR